MVKFCEFSKYYYYSLAILFHPPVLMFVRIPLYHLNLFNSTISVMSMHDMYVFQKRENATALG